MRNYLKTNVDGNTGLCMATAVVAHKQSYGFEKFREFKSFVKDFTLGRAVEVTGLTEGQILELVELIHGGKRVSFWWTMGVNQSYEAVRTAQAIINLALMTGNIGKPGTGANSITGQCNAMGSRAYSNTAVLFAGGDFTNPARRKRVAEALGVEESVLAEKPTKTYNQIIEGVNAGEIKGLWILCTNPRHSWTNNETFAQAVKKLELFVVQDIYDTIESAEGATVYFPVVSGMKKEGTYINLERRLSAMRQVLPRECFQLMKECSRGMPCDITGVTWEALENSHGIQWPFREGESLTEDQGRLYEDGSFFTPSKKAQFIFESPAENPMSTSEEFPFWFNTGRGSVGQWHTQSRTKEVKFVEDVSLKKAYLYMHTDTARRHGIKENDRICVCSANGQQADFLVKVTENVREDELFAPIHYIECNKLTPSIYDPYSKEPSYKSAAVRFERR